MSGGAGPAAEVGAIGGFFALRTGTPRTVPADGPAATLAAVYAGDDGPLARRIDRVAARLGIEERRVAASIAHLGLAARLWSVALGHAALHGTLPALHPADLRWSPDHSSPDDLLLTDPRSLPASVETIRRTVQDGHLVPLAAALRRSTRISPGLLRGNAGSALAGAVREIDTWAARTGRPQAAVRARDLAGGLFAGPGLAGTVHGPRMRRRSCCLYYRAGGGLCGDCVFDTPPAPARPTGPG
ncbi:(2Fe-2S)-binding protein [Streptomyces tsukubensis]|uniref:(2Fe-2S)-binding protein n=1 Tax=Streptomyces tsukubensis TaxID=83656 RepID=UPI0034508D9F